MGLLSLKLRIVSSPPIVRPFGNLLFYQTNNACILAWKPSRRNTMPAIRQDILQNILNVAQQSIKTIGPFRRDAPLYFPYPGSSTAPALTLRIPDYVESELHDSDVPVEFRNTLSGTITRLQKEYTNAFDDAFRQSLSEPDYLTTAIYKLHTSLEDMFVTQAIPQVMDRYMTFKNAKMARITRQLEARRLAEERERPQFNAVCPTLPSRDTAH